MAHAGPTGGVSPADKERLVEVDLLLAQGAQAVPALIALLADPSWRVRRSLISALAALGDAAVPALANVLVQQRDDENRLAAAVDALVVSTSHEVTAAMARLARHPDPAVVADAAQVLGRRREEKATPILRDLVEHEHDNVAVVAIEALGRVGGRSAVDALVAATESRDFFRAFPAIDVLGRTGDPRAVPPLAALLDEAVYVSEAARALARTGQPAAVKPLVGMLERRTDSLVRLGAVALVELVERVEERTGSCARVEQALRALPNRGVLARRLERSLPGSEPLERKSIARLLGLLGSEEAVPALLPLLDSSPDVAEVAARALATLGPESGDALAAQLRSGDSERRRVVLPVIRHASTVPDVVACLEDKDPGVRALACDALARLGDLRAVDGLVRLLDDKNPRVAHAAAAALQSLGSDRVIERVSEVARAGSTKARAHALRVLGYLGASVSEDLFLDAMRSDDPALKDTAFAGVPLLGSRRALDILFEHASEGDAATRAAAMRALGRCTVDPRATAYLLAALDDEDSWVRYHAALGLGRLKCEAAASPMRRLLAADDTLVRIAAVEALSYLDSALAQEALRAAAQSDNSDLVRAALIGLGLSGRRENLPVVLEAAESPDVAVRVVAMSALSGFEDERVVGALKEGVRDPDTSVRTAAVGLLGARRERAATRALVELARERPDERALRAALSVPLPERIDELLRALADAGDDVAPVLTSALARMQRREALAALLDAAALPNVAARKAAAETLAGIGSRDALEAVKRLATSDEEPEVRRVAALLLG